MRPCIVSQLVRRRVCDRASFAGGDLPMTSARNAAGVGELWERMRLGVSHRVHEMSERERADFFEAGGEEEAAEEAEGSDEEEERRLRRTLRRSGVRYDRRELREARRAEER